MKRLFSLLLVLILILLCGCEIKPPAPLKETSVSTSDVNALSAQIGIKMSVPAQARNVKCAIINDLIAETEFAYNGIIFVHRASKAYSQAPLYGIKGKLTEVDSYVLGEDTEVSVCTFKEGGRIALWYQNGTHHSLYTKKTLDTETIKKITQDL